MERHPVPRQISGYEFHLIGDMTLKQFAELSAGAILALLCWSLPIMTIFKFPLVLFFIFLGISLAFVPVNEQPLDRWIINFFKAVYSPTQFIWKKSEVSLDFLERQVYLKPAEPSKPITSTNGKKLAEYLRTIPTTPLSPFEKEIEAGLQRITSLFEGLGIPSIPPPSPPPKIPEVKMGKHKAVKIDREVKIPKVKLPKVVEVEKKVKKEIKKPEIIAIPKFKRVPRKTIEPKFEPKLPMPSRPTTPNILVGMILDHQGKILPDVIVEIRDKNGFPVRALRANKLGQFRIANPLKNGTYEVELEKEGYKFDIIKFTTRGEIIEPMEIRAKGKLT